jgi:hypothetical protein
VTFGPYHAIVVGEHDGDTLELDVQLEKKRFTLAAPKDLGFNVQLRKDGVWLARQPPGADLRRQRRRVEDRRAARRRSRSCGRC